MLAAVGTKSGLGPGRSRTRLQQALKAVSVRVLGRSRMLAAVGTKSGLGPGTGYLKGLGPCWLQ